MGTEACRNDKPGQRENNMTTVVCLASKLEMSFSSAMMVDRAFVNPEAHAERRRYKPQEHVREETCGGKGGVEASSARLHLPTACPPSSVPTAERPLNARLGSEIRTG